MRKEKHIALLSMMLLLIITAICMNYFIGEAAKRNRDSSLYGICINEVCSDYFPVSFSETQPASDWVELYNFSDTSKKLGGYYLSDDKDDLYKCKLPDIELSPGDYYVIHRECDEMEADEESFDFGIKAQGETLYLSDSVGSVVDVVNIPAMDTNTSWSRLSDAGDEWGNTELTYHFSNDQAELIQDKIEAPVFATPGGFYSKEFELELKASSDSTIYYTLDGSEPSSESILYENPILIKDVSTEPNVYSARNDFDALMESQVENLVEKIMIVRAIAIDADGKMSNVVTNSYIIGKEDRKNYKEMYTVSLVTDPYNLFDYYEGIYVLGKGFDDFMAEGGNLDDPIQAGANYRISGKRSERPASIEIFDENGNCILDKEVGIRIHGGTTRGCTQKSFSIYAREMYDGNDTIEGLFGENTTIRKFFIYTNREETKLRDALIARVLADRDIATQTFIYCNVFLNGEYWGIYLLAEEYDEYYFDNHYDIKPDNIQVLETASPPDVVEYINTVSDKSEPAVYENLCQMIDVQSFIDYYASMLYLNDIDWLSYNARCYRSIEAGSGKNEDGKWRWGSWDTETTMYYPDIDTFHTGNQSSWEDDPLAQALMEHEEFRKQFVNTYMDLYNVIWQENNILPIVSEMENDIAESYEMHLERFGNGNSKNEQYNKLKTFLSDRDGYVFGHVREEFQLCGDPSWLVFLSNKEEAATFRVNTCNIELSGAWWQGLYFPDYPVEIAVEEIYGDNIFLGWYNENDELISMDSVFTVNLSEGTNIICPKFATE